MSRLVASSAIVLLVASIASAQEARDIIIEGVTLGKQQKFEEAIDIFQKALEIDPASLAAYINIATASFLWSEKEGKFNYIEAMKALEMASMLAPHDRQAHRWMAQNGRRIVPYLEERVTSNPDDPIAHYDLASAYMLSGETEKAISEYQTAASLAPEAAPIHSDLGRALLRDGRTEEGGLALAKAVELDPKLSGALLNLASLRYREGDLDKALTLYLRSLEADPNNATAHAQLGNLYLELKKLKEAKRELNAALKLNRHLIYAYLDLADVYLKEKNIRGAIEQCEAALKEKQRFPEAEIILGELYYLEKDLPNARKHYRKYLQTSRQHDVEDKEMVVKFKEHCKTRIQAIRALQVKKKPKKGSEKLFKIAHRHYEAGDYDSAIDAINMILEKEESMGKAYVLLGNIFLRKEEPDPGLAMSIFRNALQGHIYMDKGTRVLGLKGLAEACYRSEKFDEAEKTLLELINLQPDYAATYYDLARLHAGKGENEKSLQNLRKGVAMEKKKRRKASLDLILEDPAFEQMSDSEELGKLREEFSR